MKSETFCPVVKAGSPAQSTRLAQALQITPIHARMDSEIALRGKGVGDFVDEPVRQLE